MTKYVAPGAGYVKIYHEDQDVRKTGREQRALGNNGESQ